MIENSGARTADWIGQTRGGVIYAYDMAVVLERRPQDVMTTPKHSAASGLLTIVPESDLISRYALASQAIFRPYDGPDEPLSFEPDDYPVR